MAAGARRRRGLVRRAIAVAAQAGRAIAARERTVRRVARGAGGVARARVEARRPRARMAGRAWRRSRRTRGTVWAMAGGAREVVAVRLRRMTARARRRRRAWIVRGVAGRTDLVSRRRSGRLARMTCRAGGALRGCVQCVGVTAGARGVTALRRLCDARGMARRARDLRLAAVRGVAAGARGVAGVRRRGRAFGVAAPARDLRDDRLAGVHDVAAEAWRGRVSDQRMTARARQRLDDSRHVRRMAGRACAWVLHALRMTGRARARRVVVLRVTRGARGMARRGEHRLRGVAGRARLHLGACERVRRVASGARAMARGDRGLGHAQRGRLRGVATHAVGRRRLVHAMAVEAAVRTGMGGLLRRVAGRAGFRLERRRAVRPVAVAARLIGVRTDGASALRMTCEARLRRVMIGSERVAVAAVGAAADRVQRRLHRSVAARADLERGRREAAVAVALRARDLADVCDVAGAVLHAEIRDRHLLGKAAIARTAARHQHDEDREPDHGREPIGWQSRHGIAASGIRLDQPGGCGLPPTRPTAWQPTHSFCPAPSWQPAHAAGSRRASRPCALSLATSPTQFAGCGLRRASPAMPRDWWHARQRSGVWHVAHAPGSARASSAWRAVKPARCTLAANGSAKCAVAGSAGTVLPWQPAQNCSR